MDGPLKTILPIGSHMHRTFYRIYWRNWRKYLPGKICCPSLPWRRRSAMPLMNIMPFVTSSKEVIRLSITTILRESRGTYHYLLPLHLETSLNELVNGC